MFGFIRSISLPTQIFVFILGLILFGIAFLLPGSLQTDKVYGNGYYYLPADGWLYSFWLEMAKLPLWLQIAPACLTALLTALVLIGNDTANLLMGQRSYAMAFVYLLLIASSGHVFIFHPAFLSGLLMVLGQRFLLGLYKEETEYSRVFVTGFTWGIAILVYPPVLFLTPALLIGLLLMVTTGWRHWTVMAMGLIIPAVLASAGWFLLGDLNYQLDSFFSWFQLRRTLVPGFFTREPFIAAWLGIILIWIVVASVKYKNPKIQSRQLFQFNFILFISILLTIALMATVSAEMLWLLVIPVSYLMTFWSLRVTRGWLRDLFFVCLLLLFAFFRIRGFI